jgi:hypothetical protein
VGKLKERDSLVYISVDGRIILRETEKCYEHVDWTHVVQDSIEWRLSWKP